MVKTYLDTNNSQTGEGDREIISHIMARLTMAKILQMLNVDISNFKVCTVSDYSYGYYNYEARIADILEFLDYVDADYDWDEVTLTINFKHPVDEGMVDDFTEALEYQWGSAEWLDEPFCDGINNQLNINLEEYDGVPLMFFKAYYQYI